MNGIIITIACAFGAWGIYRACKAYYSERVNRYCDPLCENSELRHENLITKNKLEELFIERTEYLYANDKLKEEVRHLRLNNIVVNTGATPKNEVIKEGEEPVKPITKEDLGIYDDCLRCKMHADALKTIADQIRRGIVEYEKTKAKHFPDMPEWAEPVSYIDGLSDVVYRFGKKPDEFWRATDGSFVTKFGLEAFLHSSNGVVFGPDRDYDLFLRKK
jgi:hypothetical protein